MRLTSNLTGFHIDVLTAEEEAANRQAEEKERLDLFMTALDVDDMIAHLLIQEGFTKVEELADADLSELASIEGFDESIAAELQSRAISYLSELKNALKQKQEELGLSDDLCSFEGLSLEKLIKLGEKGIKTLDDFADLASDELIDILGKGSLTETEANRLIMKAREHWFE